MEKQPPFSVTAALKTKILLHNPSRDFQVLDFPMNNSELFSNPHPIGIPKKIDNQFIDMSRTVIHQQDGIFISEFIKTSRIAKIAKVRHADLLTQNFHRAIWRCTCFSNEISPESRIAFLPLLSNIDIPEEKSFPE
jgi:hypothetical protein